MKQFFTTAYHPQTNDQAGFFNKTITSRFKNYIADHYRDWNAYLGPQTYAYTHHVHRSTENTPFNWMFSRAPPNAAMETHDTAHPPDVPQNVNGCPFRTGHF